MRTSDEFLDDPSNSACFDCGLLRPRAANLKYAILVCDRCARMHPDRQDIRLLGDVNWSELSRTQDWSEIMKIGGNNHYQEFLNDNALEPSFAVKYQSNAAHFYSCLIAGADLPDIKAEEMSLPYTPKEKGWGSSIYFAAESVYSYTAGASSKIFTTVSGSLSKTPGVLGKVARKSADAISSVVSVAGSYANTGKTSAYNAMSYLGGRYSAPENKKECIELKTIETEDESVSIEKICLSLSQSIIQEDDAKLSLDCIGNIELDEDIQNPAELSH